MKCPSCNENGINPLSKLGLIFRLDVRCQKCGARFGVSEIQSFLISVGLQGAVWLAILYALISLNTWAIYTGVVVGYALVAFVSLLVPLKQKSRHSLRDRARR